MTHLTEEEYQALLSNMAPKEEAAPDTPDPGLESKLLNKCLAYCKERGFPAWHDWSRKKNEPGWPDLQIYPPGGKPVLIELKSAKGVFRKEQQDLARQFMFLGYRYEKVRSFKRFLEVMEFNATAGT